MFIKEKLSHSNMSEEMTPEQQMEAQKANCPFCKIANGEIPAVKVYEDEYMVGIVDINPLAKGHTILFPKQHVPIMQMMPPAAFKNMFTKLPDIVSGVKQGAICNAVNLYVASGGVAGQQMPHFLLHIIPREAGDNIENFNKVGKELDIGEVANILPSLKNNMGIMLKNDAKLSQPVVEDEGVKAVEAPIHNVSQEQKKLIADFLEENDELRELLLKSPDKFAEIILQNEQTKNMFAGIDIVALSERLKPAYAEGAK